MASLGSKIISSKFICELMRVFLTSNSKKLLNLNVNGKIKVKSTNVEEKKHQIKSKNSPQVVSQNNNKDVKSPLFISQQDLAINLQTTPRMLLYWENLGLIKPSTEKKTRGKGRKYSKEDVLEIKFVKALLDDGYTANAVKEKLKKLSPPYTLDAEEIFWDRKENNWKTRKQIFKEFLQTHYLPEFQKALEKENPAEEIINLVFDILDENN